MKVSRWLVALCVVCCIWAAGVVPAGAAPARRDAEPFACDGTWQVVPPPPLGRQSGFDAVSATSATDVWVLGSAKFDPIVAHWDGLSWTVTPLPQVGSTTVFSDIAAASPTDVWAVGLTQASRHADTRGLIVHWDGVGWERESVPDVGPGGDQLSGVTTGPGGTWAVGDQLPADHSVYTTLILQRQSGSWVPIPSPNITGDGYRNYLEAVADVSPTSAIAVGSVAIGGGGFGYALGWDGVSWTVLSKPRAHRGGFLGAAGGPRGRAIAVGIASVPGGPFATVLSRSGKWKGADIPSSPYPSGNLEDAAFQSATQAWAVGYSDTQDGEKSVPLIARWDGISWSVVDSVAPRVHSGLSGVAVAGSEVWAVGGYRKGNGSHPLVERYC